MTDRKSLIPKLIFDEIQDFVFCDGRTKTSGRMWEGSATSIIGSPLGPIEVKLTLHYHGKDSETEESLKPCLCIKTVKLVVPNETYDAYWHCIWDEEELWLHKEGWSQDEKLESRIPVYNPYSRSRMMPADECQRLGFIKLIGKESSVAEAGE